MMKIRIPSLALFLALIILSFGCDSTEGEEEDGTRYKVAETAMQARGGVDLVMSYDQNTQKFNGTVTNTNDAAVSDVRVEIHLSNGTELGPTRTGLTTQESKPVTELGPTPRTGLTTQESKPVTLDATGQSFDWWSVHVELGGDSEH